MLLIWPVWLADQNQNLGAWWWFSQLSSPLLVLAQVMLSWSWDGALMRTHAQWGICLWILSLPLLFPRTYHHTRSLSQKKINKSSTNNQILVRLSGPTLGDDGVKLPREASRKNAELTVSKDGELCFRLPCCQVLSLHHFYSQNHHLWMWEQWPGIGNEIAIGRELWNWQSITP